MRMEVLARTKQPKQQKLHWSLTRPITPQTPKSPRNPQTQGLTPRRASVLAASWGWWSSRRRWCPTRTWGRWRLWTVSLCQRSCSRHSWWLRRTSPRWTWRESLRIYQRVKPEDWNSRHCVLLTTGHWEYCYPRRCKVGYCCICEEAREAQQVLVMLSVVHTQMNSMLVEAVWMWNHFLVEFIHLLMCIWTLCWNYFLARSLTFKVTARSLLA